MTEIVTKANLKVAREVMKMQENLTFEEFIREWGEENGMVDKKEIALKMLLENEPIEKIVFYTSLSPETIRSLK